MRLSCGCKQQRRSRRQNASFVRNPSPAVPPYRVASEDRRLGERGPCHVTRTVGTREKQRKRNNQIVRHATNELGNKGADDGGGL